jgi:uncharacterized membrane protein YwaF
MLGDGIKTGVKGNRRSGDGAVPVWENLLDLSHSVYSRGCHSLFQACSKLTQENGDMKFSFKHSFQWSIFISVITFILACIFTVSSTAMLEGFPWGIGMLIVILLIGGGIFFDILGLAAAAAEETPFHAMASKRVKGSRHAIYIVRNADRFSNFCNDMIGDISGVISGAASALVVFKLMSSFQEYAFLRTAVSVVFTSLVSAFTVGGKAMGKSFAIHYATEIVLLIGKFFYLLEHRLGLRFLQSKKKPKSNNGKRGNKRAARTNPTA